ncbi:hypothetical protein BVG19_g2080 [[Candida] boidinii]|nr:hypothetical protein BVG19_g2080 [[Candida] boidinii]OWB48837.1 hypothetical protein B5S27_g374 [[Candida] boidinii]
MSEITELLSKLTLSPIDESKLSTEELALKSQWETLSNTELDFTSLNDSLRSKTYIVGNSPSSADLTVFKKVFPTALSWKSTEELAKYRHIIRWIDFVQNTLVSLPAEQQLKIENYDVEVPREIKEKKAKKDEAAAPTPAATAAPVAADKKDNSDKKQGPPAGVKKELTPEQIAAQKAKADAKKAAKAAAAARQAAAVVPPNPSMIDLRVGFIQKAVKHPDADALYVSTIDMGDEEGPRTVCSGLVKHIPIEEMQERYVIVVANLKPVTMRGIKSCAMVLCASKDEHVEFVNPPAGSKPGDKIFFEGFDGTPEKVLNPKKKIWETVQPHFTSTENLEIVYQQEGKPDAKLVNKKGELCKNSTFVNADIR